MLANSDLEEHFSPSVRLVEVDRGDCATCGFHLSRVKWDPYPWISKIDPGSVAEEAGMRPGDCLLEVNGEDVVGKRISEIAVLIKNLSHLSLLLWNAGVNKDCSSETLCCGPMPNNFQRLTACTNVILKHLECPICLNTAAPPIQQCDNGHLICVQCGGKTERCPVCRIRFTRGRCLLGDNVYNAISDAFDLRNMTQEGRNMKMNQIMKLKSKMPTNGQVLPTINVTNAHTNKFLAKLIGKATSVDNLSCKTSRTQLLDVNNEFDCNLRAKSVSSCEIFNKNENTLVSRSNSINHMPCSRSPSMDSSFRPRDEGNKDDLFYCPFNSNCAKSFKESDLVSHFQSVHDGPLIQYFKPTLRIKLIETQDTYLIVLDGKYFILKILQEDQAHSCRGNVHIWVWLLGSKKLASDFQLNINLFMNSFENTLLRICSPIFSLNCVSWSDIMNDNRTAFLHATLLNSLNIAEIFIDIEVFLTAK